jgi:tetratricopeptide (TPR) repeat protein
VIVSIVLAVVTYGIVLVPIGLGIWWWIHRRHQQPQYIAGQFIKKANAQPQPEAVHLYHQAIDSDPTGAATLRKAADWFYQNACWSDAADAYAGYLHLEKSAGAEHNYARSLLASGHTDEAISEFQGLVATSNEVPVPLISELAGAFLLKGDATQALAIAKEAPLQRHHLDDGLQKALLARAFAEYMLGVKPKAISDLDRLYAVNPNFPQVSEIKQRMLDGTFQIEAPIARPAWYPAEVEVREGPAVEEVQDGHPDEMPVGSLSPDGMWSWSGTHWMPANEPPTSASPTATPSAADPESAPPVATSELQPESENAPPQFSSDGAWWWNGKEWIPNVSDEARGRQP